MLLLTHAVFGQNTSDKTEVLELIKNSNYQERNKFWHDSGITLRQEVAYNDRHIIDEEYSQLLTIKFLDVAKMTDQRIFDAVKDTSIIRFFYARLSVWNWSEKKTKIEGQVKLISKSKTKIELEFNIRVIEPGKGSYVYNGKRKFRKSKPLVRYSYRLDAGNNGFGTIVGGRKNAKPCNFIELYNKG
jgi:hypothetical protein